MYASTEHCTQPGDFGLRRCLVEIARSVEHHHSLPDNFHKTIRVLFRLVWLEVVWIGFVPFAK